MAIRIWSARLYDGLDAAWNSSASRRGTSHLLLVLLVFGLVLVELERRDLLPALVEVPTNHFVVVEWVVDLLLLFELIDLVLGLASSVASAVAKQLEIFALILLRKSFEELRHFEEPIDLSALPNVLTFAENVLPIWQMAADALGALSLFGALILYQRLQHHRRITETESELERFVMAKKVVSVLLLGVVGTLLVQGVVASVLHGEAFDVYPDIFTAFIFFDIAVVLISLRYSQKFPVVFRNFGFTVVTVFLRLAITANPIERAAMGMAVGLYAVAVAYLYNLATNQDAGEP
ncbi:MAG: hypothetical protein ACFB9M_10075 [Myxococcota bacterium]